VELSGVLCEDANVEKNEEYVDINEAEAEARAVEALLTLQRLKLSGHLSASKQVSALAKPLGLVVQSPRLPRSLPICDLDSEDDSIQTVVNNQNVDSEVIEAVNVCDTGSGNAREPVNTSGVNTANTRRHAVDNVSDTWPEGSVEAACELNSAVNTPVRVLTPSLEVVGSSDHLRQLDRRQNRSVPQFGPGGTHVCSFGSEAPVNRPASDTLLLQRQPTADVRDSSAMGDHTYAKHPVPPATSVTEERLAPTLAWARQDVAADNVTQLRSFLQTDGTEAATGIRRVDKPCKFSVDGPSCRPS